jgi:hypothetical protein
MKAAMANSLPTINPATMIAAIFRVSMINSPINNTQE